MASEITLVDKLAGSLTAKELLALFCSKWILTSRMAASTWTFRISFCSFRISFTIFSKRFVIAFLVNVEMVSLASSLGFP